MLAADKPGVRSVANGFKHSLYVLDDGTLWATGDNQYGQLGDGTTTARMDPVMIASDVQMVAAGQYHSLFLKNNGGLWVMGRNDSGQLGGGSTTDRQTPVQVASNVRFVTARLANSFYVHNNGRMYGMGGNSYGQLGTGDKSDRNVVTLIAEDVSTVATSGNHTLFIKTDGSLWAMGNNTHGQLANGLTHERLTPVKIMNDVMAVATGNRNSFYIKTNGNLWAVGRNENGVLGTGSDQTQYQPAWVTGRVRTVAANLNSACFLADDGSLWITGTRSTGVSGNGAELGTYYPRKIAERVQSVQAGQESVMFIRTSGELWGRGYFTDQFGNSGSVGNEVVRMLVDAGGGIPRPRLVHPERWEVNAEAQGYMLTVDIPGPWSMSGVPAWLAPSPGAYFEGARVTVAVSANNTQQARTAHITIGPDQHTVTQQGVAPPTLLTDKVTHLATGAVRIVCTVTSNGGATVTERGLIHSPLPDPTLTSGTKISAGGGVGTYAVNVTGLTAGTRYYARAYAINDAGIAYGNQVSLLPGAEPLPVVTALSAGTDHSLYIDAHGTLWGMGRNVGEISHTGSNVSFPTAIRIADHVAAAAAGGGHTLYVKSDGSLWAMGRNTRGQLGDGTTTTRIAHVQVAADVQGVAAGADHSLFVKTDGTLWAMGYNDRGQLGDQTYTTRLTPALIATGVQSVAAGAAHSLYVKTDGTLWAMGRNDTGQLGDHTTVDRNMPVRIAEKVRTVSAGAYHSMFIRMDGTLWAMGGNTDGQLGYHINVNQTTPVRIAENVHSVAAGATHSLFITKDGALWSAGQNTYGQLATGSRFNYFAPVKVAQGIAACAAGDGFSLFASATGNLWSVGRNTRGQLGMGTTDDQPTAVWVHVPDPSPLQPLSVELDARAQTYTISITGGHAWSVAQRPDWLTVTPGNGIGDGVIQVAVTANQTLEPRTGSIVIGTQSHVVTQRTLPSITAPPPRRVVLTSGQNLLLSVGTNNSATISYQWRHNGRPIAGANGSTYFKQSIAPMDAGYYTLDATAGTGLSASATVFVVIRPVAPQVLAWGSGIDGRATVQPRLQDVVAVATGGTHTLALRADGTVTGWGSNNFGQITIPEGLTDVVAIAAGGSHSLALRVDGTVVAWGNSNDSQTKVPANLADVVAIAAYSNLSMALQGHGRVVTWGGGSIQNHTQPDNLTDVVAIAAGSSHFLALKADGTVAAWGSNSNGKTNVPEGLADVVAVAAATSHSMALKADGSVVGWGENRYGQSVPPDGLAPAIAISTTYNTTLALRADGTLVRWGEVPAEPSIPPGLDKVLAIAAAGTYTVVLREAAGDDLLGIAVTSTAQVREIGATVVLEAVSPGWPMTYQWRKDGVPIAGAIGPKLIFAAAQPGDSGAYSVVVGNLAGTVTSAPYNLSIWAPPVVTVAQARTVVAAGATLALSGTATGVEPLQYQWLHDGRPIPGATTTQFTKDAVRYQDSGCYTLEVTDAGGLVTRSHMFVNIAPAPLPAPTQVVTWGGSNTGGERDIPPGLTDAVAVAGGPRYSLALKADGTVVGWGLNDVGQIDVPADLTDAVAIAAGQQHALALRADGTVVAWGNNQLGRTEVPAGLADVVAIAAGERHSLALQADGTAVAWSTKAGAAGWIPQNVTNDFIAVATGKQHSAGIRPDGTVAVWNAGLQGNIPASLQSAVAIAAAMDYSMALKPDGTLAYWGSVAFFPPAGLDNLVAIAAGDYLALALREDGTVAAWPVNTVAPPEGLDQVIAIAAGAYHALALRDTAQDPLPLVTIATERLIRPVGDAILLTSTVVGWPLHYQWYKDGEPIAGAIESSLLIANAATDDSGAYTLVASNIAGDAVSNAIALSVQYPPAITAPPPPRGVADIGQPLTLAVQASGKDPLSYQWKHNNRAIPGANGTTHVIASVNHMTTGFYTIEITDADGLRSRAISHVYSRVDQQHLIGWGAGPVITNMPDGHADFIDVSVGSAHAVALQADGTVVAWSFNDSVDSVQVPAGLSDVVAIAATVGGSATLALKADGSIVGWGSNQNGVLEVPDDLKDVVAIACSNFHGMALTADGTVRGWGGSMYSSTFANPPASVRDVVAISAGTFHALALLADGTVRGWGVSNRAAQGVPSGLADVVAISAGSDHSLALRADGTVVGWGGVSSSSSALSPQAQVPEGLDSVIAIAAGYNHSLALTSDRRVVAWGENAQGQATVPAAMANVVAIYAGGTGGFSGDLRPVSMAMMSARDLLPPVVHASIIGRSVRPIGAWILFSGVGTGDFIGLQWHKDGIPIPGATMPQFLIESAELADSGAYTLVATNPAGSVSSAQIVLEIRRNPIIVTAPAARSVLAAGAALTLSVEAQPGGAAPLSYRWKHNGRVIPGATDTQLGIADFSRAAAGYYVVEVSDADGLISRAVAFVLAAVGKAHVVVFGQNATTHMRPPAGLDDMIAIAAGSAHALALRADGRVVAWGHSSASGIQVPTDLEHVVAISAGTAHSLALTAEGRVLAWGDNTHDQLNIPDDLHEVVAIWADSWVSKALQADGTVVTWGQGITGSQSVWHGEASAISGTRVLLADGTVTGTGVPAGVQNITRISTGDGHTLAVSADGRLHVWGTNLPSDMPANLTNVVAVAAKYYHCLALLDDGSVVAWGWNGSGQVDIPHALDHAVGIAVGYEYSLILRDQALDPLPTVAIATDSPVRAIGDTVEFRATTTGWPLNYQWKRNGAVIPGANAATLLLANAQASLSGSYTLTVTNLTGSTTSAAIDLTVRMPPVITQMPQRRNVTQVGARLEFNALATGTTPLTYSWKHNGRPIAGANGPQHAIASVDRADAGYYIVEITDPGGLVTRAAFFVLVPYPEVYLSLWGEGVGAAKAYPQVLHDVITVQSTGSDRMFALLANGTVTAWSDRMNDTVPAGLQDVVAISTNRYHTLALKADGTVVAWGNNAFGQLNIPEGLSGVVAVAAGPFHGSIALRNDGTIAHWGYGDYYSENPNVTVAVSAGHGFYVALNEDGTAGVISTFWFGVYNEAYIPLFTDVVAIAAGQHHVLALRADGSVTGAKETSASVMHLPQWPVEDVTAIAAGRYHSLALRGDGRVIGWGTNQFGQLNIPYALKDVVHISACMNSSLALSLTPLPQPEDYFGPMDPIHQAWHELDGFGRFDTARYPWIYHEQHGWLLAEGAGGGWWTFHDQAIGWWSVDPRSPYHHYIHDRAKWYFCDPDAAAPNRWYYDCQGRLWASEAYLRE